MAQTGIIYNKRAMGNGEDQFEAEVGVALAGTTPVATSGFINDLALVRINKNKYDSLSAANKTAFEAVTLGDFLTAVYLAAEEF